MPPIYPDRIRIDLSEFRIGVRDSEEGAGLLFLQWRIDPDAVQKAAELINRDLREFAQSVKMDLGVEMEHR